MRRIESATIFRKELKRLNANPDHRDLGNLLETVLDLLVNDEPLPARNHDHALTGPYKGFRDCHVKPDVVLIYSKHDKNILWLARIGTHANLF